MPISPERVPLVELGRVVGAYELNKCKARDQIEVQETDQFGLNSPPGPSFDFMLNMSPSSLEGHQR